MSGGRRAGRKLRRQKAQMRPAEWKRRVLWVESRARRGGAWSIVVRYVDKRVSAVQDALLA